MIDYDSPEQVELRKNQADPLVMYLVVRESLGMSMGKVAAQVGHAVDMVMLKFLTEGGWRHFAEPRSRVVEAITAEDAHLLSREPEPLKVLVPGLVIEEDQAEMVRRAQHALYAEWLTTSFRKVALKADDKEWAKLKACDEIRFEVVRDAGLTEVAAGSETVMAVWPMFKSRAPKVIKRLQVLK